MVFYDLKDKTDHYITVPKTEKGDPFLVTLVFHHEVEGVTFRITTKKEEVQPRATAPDFYGNPCNWDSET